MSGIKWRRLRPADHLTSGGGNSQKDPLDDPVLCSYSKCLGAGELLCAWTRVERPAPDSGQPAAAASLTKELWIFWYAKDPDLSDLLSKELHGECSYRSEACVTV